MSKSFDRLLFALGSFVGLSIVAAVAVLLAGCQFGVGGAVRDLAPGADSSFAKLTGVDGRGADKVVGAVGVDTSDTESNEATQGATTITGEGATVYNVQAVGGSAIALLILGLGAAVLMFRRKTGDTTEALDRVMDVIRKDKSASGIRTAIHDAGCSTHPTRGHIHDRAESVIRNRLNIIRVNDR